MKQICKFVLLPSGHRRSLPQSKTNRLEMSFISIIKLANLKTVVVDVVVFT